MFDKIKERDLVDSIYLLLEIINFASLDERQKLQFLRYFYNNSPSLSSIKILYSTGLSLDECERKVFWRGFLRAKVELKLNDQDAITYAKLSTLIYPRHVNYLWLEIRSYNNESLRWTQETMFSSNKNIIDFTFKNRHLKGVRAWVQDLDGVKTLMDNEKPPFEITEKQASDLINFPDKILDSYTRLRRTIPELKHETAIKVAQNLNSK